MNSVAVIGSGQAALAMAAFISKAGKSVYMHYDHAHPGCLAKINNRSILTEGEINGEFTVAGIYNDIREVVNQCQIIFIVSPTYSHEAIYKKMSSCLTACHYVYNITANFSSVALRDYCGKSVVSDISLFPFACRMVDDTLNLIGRKNKVLISSLDPSMTRVARAKIDAFFPSHLSVAKNVFEVGLSNVNAICHPAIMLLNAGRIGSGNEDFYFNKEGVSKPVATLLESLEQDRQNIARMLGFEPTPFLKIMDDFYGEEYDSVYDFFQSTSILNKNKLCPSQVGGRYLDEDIAYLLYPWECIANIINVNLNAITTLIDLASLLTGVNYRELGRRIYKEQLECYMLSNESKVLD
jgi:opine dehydrogenase